MRNTASSSSAFENNMRTFDGSPTVKQQACPTCGRRAGALEEMLVEVRIDLQGAESEVKRQRREITRLKTELQRQRQDSPQFERAKRLFDKWVRLLGKNGNTVFDPKRQKMLIDMLALYDRNDVDGDALMGRAVEGLAKFRYVGPCGRQSTSGGGKLYDDLKFAVQDAESVERFAGYLEQSPERKANVMPIRRRGPDPFDRPVDRVLVELRRAELDYRPGVAVDTWMAQCPAHEDRLPSLSIRLGEDGRALLNCFAGCEVVDICNALGMSLSQLFARSA